MNRTQRRTEAQHHEADVARELYLNHKAKLVALPDKKAETMVQRWKADQVRRIKALEARLGHVA